MLNVIFQNTAPAPLVMLQLTISCGTMVRRNVRFSVKSAKPIFHQRKIIGFPKQRFLGVLTVITVLFIKKTVNTLSFTNV